MSKRLDCSESNTPQRESFFDGAVRLRDLFLNKKISDAQLVQELERLHFACAAQLEMLQAAVQYAVNRLDADKDQPQVAGDLAVALAYSKSATRSENAATLPAGYIGIREADLRDMLEAFKKANWPDTKAGNAAARIADALSRTPTDTNAPDLSAPENVMRGRD